MNIIPNATACLSCAFPFMPKAGSLPTCDTVGVLNTIPSIIASIQATEAIKIILNKDYSKGLLIYDVWNHEFKSIKIKRNEDCITCGENKFEYLDAEKRETTTILCGRNSVKDKYSKNRLIMDIENLYCKELQKNKAVELHMGDKK